MSAVARFSRFIALSCLCVLPALGQWENPVFRSVRSSSGQFIVAIPSNFAESSTPSTNSARFELSPTTLVVSCERIKSMLLRELGFADLWFYPVNVIVNPAIPDGEPPIIGLKLYRDGWRYRVELPLRIEPAKLVHGIVQVLFLEMANRTATTRSAEIPLWLTEGFSQYLIASSQLDLVVGDPNLTVNGVQVRWQNRAPAIREPLKEVRERLQEYAAFSFTRMGEFEPSELSEETWKTFQASSHLLVDQLLRLPGARAQLGIMLSQLPQHLNWQIPFLNAFHAQFPRMLDVEKWWSVVLVHFSGLDSANAWSIDVALAKMAQAITPPVLVSEKRQDLPHRANLRLQDIIDRFDYLRQRILLQDVLRQLLLLRVYTPPPAVPLLDDYRHTIEDYLNRRDRAGMARSLPGLPPMNSDRLVHEIIEKLNGLDQARAVLSVNNPSTSTASAQ